MKDSTLAILIGIVLGVVILGPALVFIVDETASAPDPCLEAIEAAKEYHELFGEFSVHMEQYPNLVVDAAMAGTNRDADAIKVITARLEQSGEDIRSITERLVPVRDKFTDSSEQCN